MSSFINFFIGTNGISSSTFWNNLLSLVPFILMLIPVAYGVYFVRKLIKMRYGKIEL